MPNRIDLDEPPLFEIDSIDEPDRSDGERGTLRAEGVTIPFDVLEHGNGRLPDELLERIGIQSHRLHRTAAAGFRELRSAAAAAGIDLTCTDSYRTFAQQVDLKKRKPFWSATPGRSVHGWGFALDLSLGMPQKPFGHSVLNWLKENGPPIGWFLGRPKDEPWHWVFRGPGGTSPGTTTASTDVDLGAGKIMTSNAEVMIGSSGLAVTIARALLDLPAGSVFDETTDQAVRAFQETHDLVVDGRVGPNTWAKLRGTTAPAERPTIRIGAEGDTVRWLQRRVGAIVDGDFGPVTRRAVMSFQAAAGLTVDGIVGPKTWPALIA
jgi:hypothetical protein